MQMNEKIEIRLFGEFSLLYKSKRIDLAADMGKQLRILFQYIVIDYPRATPKKKLTEELFANCKDAKSSLKYCIFRLRNFFQSYDLFGEEEFIVTTKDGYSLNPNYTYDIDILRFQECITVIDDVKNIANSELIREKLEKVREIYRGPISLYVDTGMGTNAKKDYYHKLSLFYMEKLCAIYMQEGMYEKVLSICREILETDPFLEIYHYFYMCALYEMREFEKLISYFTEINQKYIDRNEKVLSVRCRELYQKVLMRYETQTPTLSSIKNELSERNKEIGAYFCTFDMFQYLFHFIVRSQGRESINYYIILFELKTTDTEEVLKRSVSKLRDSIKTCLRSGDVYTRYNKNVILVLVPCNTKDNAFKLIERISKDFYTKIKNKKVKLTYNMEGVLEDDHNQE